MQAFVEDEMEVKDTGFITRTAVSSAYEDYCKANGLNPVSRPVLYKTLADSYKEHKRYGNRGYKGICTREDEEA